MTEWWDVKLPEILLQALKTSPTSGNQSEATFKSNSGNAHTVWLKRIIFLSSVCSALNKWWSSGDSLIRKIFSNSLFYLLFKSPIIHNSGATTSDQWSFLPTFVEPISPLMLFFKYLCGSAVLPFRPIAIVHSEVKQTRFKHITCDIIVWIDACVSAAEQKFILQHVKIQDPTISPKLVG